MLAWEYLNINLHKESLKTKNYYECSVSLVAKHLKVNFSEEVAKNFLTDMTDKFIISNDLLVKYTDLYDYFVENLQKAYKVEFIFPNYNKTLFVKTNVDCADIIYEVLSTAKDNNEVKDLNESIYDDIIFSDEPKQNTKLFELNNIDYIVNIEIVKYNQKEFSDDIKELLSYLTK